MSHTERYSEFVKKYELWNIFKDKKCTRKPWCSLERTNERECVCGFPDGLVVKNPHAKGGNPRDTGSVPG